MARTDEPTLEQAARLIQNRIMERRCYEFLADLRWRGIGYAVEQSAARGPLPAWDPARRS